MSGFQREQEREENSGFGWKALAVGAGALALGGLAAYALYEHEDYSQKRHTHLNQCRDAFVNARDLLRSGDLQLGDMIEFKRSLYQHWALYIGDGFVIHVNDKKKIVIMRLIDVADNCPCRVNLLEVKARQLNLKQKGSRYVIVARAKAMEGQIIDYDICDRNCEHFVTECFYGTAFSVQQDILNRNATAKVAARLGATCSPHD